MEVSICEIKTFICLEFIAMAWQLKQENRVLDFLFRIILSIFILQPFILNAFYNFKNNNSILMSF